MNNILRQKPIKAKLPYKTINNIRNILEELNLFTTEVYHSQENKNFYSCRIELSNTSLKRLNIGTNGKGLSPEYALASAYGEFMERLQNNFLFRNLKYATKKYISQNNCSSSQFIDKLKEYDLILDFIEEPNEKFIPIEILLKNNTQVIENLTNKKKSAIIKYFDSLKIKELLCVPFYNLQNNDIEYLPIDLINYVCGSSGLCAGNTKEEAIIQGICEIFERYAIKKIYYDNVTPPTIPRKYFEGTDILKKIEFIERKNNYSIVIKDCSLGEGLPVLGVLIIDKTNNKYAFNLGSDPSPITTLERCISEVYQGDLGIKFRKIHINEDIIARNEYTKHLNFYKTFTSGTGYWPNNIFFSDASYSFNGFDFPITQNDITDLNNIINKIHELGFNIYIRDVSYLNFPSFRIYIPGMSEASFETLREQLVFDALCQSALFDLKNATTEQIINITDILSSAYEKLSTYKSNIGNLFLFNDNFDLNDTEIEIFLAMLFYRIEDYKNSYKYIEKYIKLIDDKKIPQYLYYLCLRDFIKLKIDNFSDENIIETLSQIYGDNLIKEISNDLSAPKEIFKYFNLPSCFNCERCEIKENCLYLIYLKHIKSIQIKKKQNQINQIDLKKIFDKNSIKYK